MVTVNSVSGGKTSAFMALNYPADFNVFSLVTIEAEYCKPKDKGLIDYVSEKIGKDFIATAESDLTLYALRDLEQQLGKSVTWVTGKTFEQVIRRKKALPNQFWRFCTSEMKMKPIFDFCQKKFNGELVDMRIGFRSDEIERAERNKNNTSLKVVVGRTKNGTQNRWGNVEWRKLSFPLIEDKVYQYDIYKWNKTSNIFFPSDSNCVGCFWKPVQQLRKNWDNETKKMRWFSDMEKEVKRQFKKEMSYEQIQCIGLQLEFNFGTGSGCQAGFCTD